MRRFLLCTALLALALTAAPAAAFGAANHPFLSAINGGYEDACGVALNGGLYVSDYYHDSIVTPSGQIAPESKGSGPCKLAFDSAGNLYVNDWHEKVVKYNAGEFTSGAGTVIDSAQPTGLTVDQATGDVYVAHRTYVAKYDAAGALLEEIGGAPGELEEAYGVAVSEFPATAGDIYVPDAATNTVKVFNPTGSLVEEMDGAATPQSAFTYLVDAEVAVDNSPTSPSYGHLFVLDAIGHGRSEHPEAVLDEFNAAGNYRGQIAGFTDAEPSGIAIDSTSHNVYVTSGNSEGSAVFVYGPTAPARSLTVKKAGTGGGSVTSSPNGIACGKACAAEFNEGEKVTLNAAPDAHSVFSGWSLPACPGTGSCTVLMSANVEVSAGFEEPTQETLTVTRTGQGSLTSSPVGISCPGTCSEHFNQGRLVTLTATPASGSHLAAWGDACAGTPLSEACKVTMSEAKAVSAEFAPDPVGSAPFSASAAAPATLALGKTSVQGMSATLQLAVSGPGTVLAGGPGLQSVEAQTRTAGNLTLRLALSKAGRHALARARHRRLKVKATVAFTPVDGGASAAATRALNFRSAPWRRTKAKRHPGR